MNEISKEAKVTLLLCGTLGKKAEGCSPLTPAQYNVFADALAKTGHGLSDILTDESIVSEVCKLADGDKRIRKPILEDNVLLLLRRGVLLSMCIDKWKPYSISVACRTDPQYPKRLLEHLGSKSPALIYYSGNEELLNGGGMAFVGARDASEDSLSAVKDVVKLCTDLKMNTVSGGARGIDETSMVTALKLGGNVIGALSGDLMKSCLKPTFRDALSKNRILLFSSTDPSIGFTPINAMERNKYIYAMADSCFVAQSGTDGGTWSGAIEELGRSNHRRVFIYMPDNATEGNRKLVSEGGIPWPPGFNPFSVTEPVKQTESSMKVHFSKGQATLDCF